MRLEQTITDWRERASDARRLGNAAQAIAIEEVLEDVTKAAEPLIRHLSEDRAMLYTEKSRRWLRARFPGWERQGFAGWDDKGGRWYLQCALPIKLDTEAIVADAERTAREDGV